MIDRNAGKVWHMVGTTPRAQALGEGLRRARENAGFSTRRLATAVGKSHTTVTRWESGERPPKPVDVATILGILTVENQLREELLELASEPDGRHWVAADLPDVQRQIATLLEMERDAKRIVEVSQLLVPGLIQTRDYARAIIGAGGVPSNEIETRIAVRLGRRDAITRRYPAHLLVLMDESALHRNIGGPSVMVDQLRELLTAAERPNVEVRLIPMDVGWHPALAGPFKLVEFENRSPVVQVDNRRSAYLLHQPVDVQLYVQAAEWVYQVSMPVEKSLEIIAAKIAEEENTTCTTPSIPLASGASPAVPTQSTIVSR